MKKHIYNVWLCCLTKFKALASLKPQESYRLRNLKSQRLHWPFDKITLSEVSLFSNFHIFTRHPCKAGSLNLLLLGITSIYLVRKNAVLIRSVMEWNRVSLYVSFYGHQFGPPKNCSGANDVISMCFNSSVVQHCRLSSVEAAYILWTHYNG